MLICLAGIGSVSQAGTIAVPARGATPEQKGASLTGIPGSRQVLASASVARRRVARPAPFPYGCGVVDALTGGYRADSTHSYASVESATLLVDTSRNNRAIPVKIWFPTDVPPGRLPVVIFSHGGGANPDGDQSYSEWGSTLAAAGYVSIHPSHNSGDRAGLCGTYGLGSADCSALSTLQVDRPLDATFVLSHLAAIEAAFPVLTGRLDSARVAVAGHSFGSYTVTSTAGGKVNLSKTVPTARGLLFSDPRVRAFLALSPQGIDRFGWEADSWDGLTRPYMTITGSCDDSAGEQAIDRLDPFRYAPAGDKYLAYVTGAYHKTIGGNGYDQPGFPRPDLVPFIRMAAIAFLDSSLKDCSAAKQWLRTQGLSSASAGRATMHWKLLDSQETAIPVTACSPAN